MLPDDPPHKSLEGQSMSESYKSLSGALTAAVLLAGTGSASAGVISLIDEDFQDVTGVTSSATVVTVQSVLAGNPAEIDGNPTRIVAGEATEASFTVRRWNNAIDGSGPITFGDSDFDNFFGGTPNQFLVIGDNGAAIGGEPNGQTASATSTLIFDLGLLPSSAQELQIVLDFVFDANITTNTDDFLVSLVLADSSVVNLLSYAAPGADSRGTLDATINLADLAAAPTSLSLSLFEENGRGDSAVGIDNLRVSAVPEPSSLLLGAIGLLGLVWSRQRRMPAPVATVD